MGARVVSKIQPAAQGLRAKPEARGLRDGIFDTTQAPIWYFHYLIVYYLKNICFKIVCNENGIENGIENLATKR